MVKTNFAVKQNIWKDYRDKLYYYSKCFQKWRE
jgi:hypothetical protein